MARVFPRLLALALVLLSVSSGALADASPSDALLSSLRRGGYVLFIRHLNTNPDQADTDPLHLENVKAQRQLTDEGRARATALGAALRTLGVPVERVIASKFNRAQETAQLLALGEVEGSLDVTEGGLVVPPRENQRRAAALRKLLVHAKVAGKNLVIVSHRLNLQEAAGKEFGDIAEGEVAVFEPNAAGRIKLVQRVSVENWLKWASKETHAKAASGANKGGTEKPKKP
jgi:phosphohistidine phosphatase SixA